MTPRIWLTYFCQIFQAFKHLTSIFARHENSTSSQEPCKNSVYLNLTQLNLRNWNFQIFWNLISMRTLLRCSVRSCLTGRPVGVTSTGIFYLSSTTVVRFFARSTIFDCLRNFAPDSARTRNPGRVSLTDSWSSSISKQFNTNTFQNNKSHLTYNLVSQWNMWSHF